MPYNGEAHNLRARLLGSARRYNDRRQTARAAHAQIWKVPSPWAAEAGHGNARRPSGSGACYAAWRGTASSIQRTAIPARRRILSAQEAGSSRRRFERPRGFSSSGGLSDERPSPFSRTGRSRLQERAASLREERSPTNPAGCPCRITERPITCGDRQRVLFEKIKFYAR